MHKILTEGLLSSQVLKFIDIFYYYYYYYYYYYFDVTHSIVTKLMVDHWINLGWILGISRKMFTSPNCQDFLQGTMSHLSCGNQVLSMRLNPVRHETDHIRSCITEVSNAWRCTSTPSMPPQLTIRLSGAKSLKRS